MAIATTLEQPRGDDVLVRSLVRETRDRQSADGATHLYLLRHGESMPQVERRIGGMRGDAGLSPLGVRQAERLRARLAATGELHADVLIASTLPRARQTAEIVAPALELPIVWDDEVQELRPGDSDGMTQEEANAAFGVANFEVNAFRPVSPGGETWGQFVLRVANALERIAREHAGERIVVVCHGGVIDSSFVHFFRMNTLHVPAARFWTENTSITEWDYPEAADGRRRWRLLRYNDVAHLYDLDGEPLYRHRMSARQEVGVGGTAVPVPTEEGAGE